MNTWYFEETTAFDLNNGCFLSGGDVTELILGDSLSRDGSCGERGTRPAIHEPTPAQTASENPQRFQGQVVNMHIT